MSDGGKGSAPRPYSVDKETFDSNWDRIFKPKMDHYSDLPSPESYQDILSTEDCVLNALNQMHRDIKNDTSK
jgi:hypothetical protein